jgi:hypothetical protein
VGVLFCEKSGLLDFFTSTVKTLRITKALMGKNPAPREKGGVLRLSPQAPTEKRVLVSGGN